MTKDTLKVSDCVAMPEKKKLGKHEEIIPFALPTDFNTNLAKHVGYNQAREEISNLPLSESKLREKGWVYKEDFELDEDRITHIINMFCKTKEYFSLREQSELGEILSKSLPELIRSEVRG